MKPYDEYKPFVIKANLFDDEIDDLMAVPGYLYDVEMFGHGYKEDIEGNPFRDLARIEDVAAKLGCDANALRREVRLMMDEAALELAA